jgi:hypothetical protein
VFVSRHRHILKIKAKDVPLHATEALGGSGVKVKLLLTYVYMKFMFCIAGQNPPPQTNFVQTFQIHSVYLVTPDNL